jgi:hypothetical protein
MSLLWRNKSEKREGSTREKNKEKCVCVSHSMMSQCVDTLLDYMGQSGLKYSDIIAAKKIYTSMRRSLTSSEKQMVIIKFF